jgi:hypothetical protein
MGAYFVVLVLLLLIIYLVRRKVRKNVLPAIHLSITYNGRINNMERYKLTWTPSPDTFVEKQQVLAGENGATPAQEGDDLPSSASSTDVVFTTDAQVVLFIRTIGDNESQADSAQLTFKAGNLEVVRAATGLAVEWKEHLA